MRNDLGRYFPGIGRTESLIVGVLFAYSFILLGKGPWFLKNDNICLLFCY